MSQGLSSTLQEITQHATQAFSKAVSDVAHGGLDKVVTEEQLRAATQKLRETVVSKPWQSVTVALLVGVIVGMSLRK